AVGAESARISISHLYTGPAIGVVAGGGHRTGADLTVVVCEIYNGSHAQSHIEHIETRSDQTEREGVLCVFRVFAEVMTYNHVFATTVLFKLQEFTQPITELPHPSIIN